MTFSVLLRVVTKALAQGRVAGHAEIVDTGESVVFKDQEEMLAFLQGASVHGTAADKTAADPVPLSSPIERGDR